MKRMISMFLLFTMMILPALSEQFDLSSLSFEELQELKQQVDAEYFSREEAEAFDLSDGEYVVGIDVKPGRYYITKGIPSDKDYVFVSIKGGFTGNKVIWSKYLDYCDKPQRIALEAGQTVKVYYGTARLKNTPFTDDDYYQYEQPSGTYVPVGKYVVGEDIPEGIYYAYAGTIEGGTIKVYENKPDLNTGYNGDKYDYYDPFVNKSGQYELVELKGGQVMFVEKDVIMKKQPKLVFD